ncbi:hypothetical protein KY338_04245 [Candidatus Woesearchaeota archaeon]|nr:hypothetical protein [Candidatus Woesearchaeota archaeon]MBW3005808.1 hypothetical protein [Candidatus Woesearchaeota archaeon]
MNIADIVSDKNWGLFSEPVVFPSLESEGDNIYAPCVLLEGSRFKMWYGGQGKDGHDRIHYAASSNGVDWVKKGVVLDNKDSLHVNDPSVVLVDNTYYMYYSRAHKKDTECRICLATSVDGIDWQKRGEVLGVSDRSWDSLEVARPSVIYEDKVFKLWYDGSDGKDRHAGYAVSEDGLNFKKHNDYVLDSVGAVNVNRVGDKYLMLFESREGTWCAVGDDERKFNSKHLLIGRSGSVHDVFGHVTPFLLQGADRIAIFLGMAASKQWCNNRIGLAAFTVQTHQ